MHKLVKYYLSLIIFGGFIISERYLLFMVYNYATKISLTIYLIILTNFMCITHKRNLQLKYTNKYFGNRKSINGSDKQYNKHTHNH